ncbi:MAG: hypothetical protein JXE06_10715 [Coriobacteriia bacterium]|nr:hypothetical protein [Coriobacteriia bacterium]MBN2822288.1 hypothetical protein [Coriobacteriia bacterium]
MNYSECIIEQYRGDKLVRSFTPTGDQKLPWSMNVNGKSYLRTSGWVLSKVLPTLVEGSPFTTKVIPITEQASRDDSESGVK